MIFARVDVRVSMMPVVRRPRTEKKFVEVAFVVELLVENRLVVVALVPVAFMKVKFCNEDEPVRLSSLPYMVVNVPVVEKRFVEVALVVELYVAKRFVVVALPATRDAT